MTKVFLNRPVLAAVCSLLILVAGIVVMPSLPIAQFPQVAPPVVSVTATYTGASPQAVEAQVTTVLEQAVNTVQGLRYVSSTSAQGLSTITCTFDLGVNLDIAAADVQNSVQSALGQLPAAVQQLGLTVAKNSGTFVMGIALTSDNTNLDALQMSNYAQINVVNNLERIQGVSGVVIFGQRQYAMRIWLNPVRLAQLGLDASDVVTALQQQNVAVAAGSIGAPPSPQNQPYTYTVNALTQLSDPKQFANIILRANPNGGYVRLSDVGRIELGAQSYTSDLRFDGQSRTVGMGVQQYPTANALDVASRVRAQMDQLASQFPAGMHWTVAFDVTTFVQESIKEVLITLLLSIVLVIGVIFLFLQNPKSTMIPAATIPVSLIGAFFVMSIFGFSINTITLFGLTLATGLVVDDAIVVIENIARHMEMNKGKQSGIASAAEAMREIQSAVVASSLVLLAVFIPVGFLPGTTGQIYKQFALTIAAAITISLFQALTLAPVLSSRLLQGEHESNAPFFRWFNHGYHRFRDWYAHVMPKLMRRQVIVAGVFVAALVITGLLLKFTEQGFLPNEDLGYFIILVQAPEGTSLDGEQTVSKKAEAIIRSQPEVQHVFNVGGFSFTGNAPNRGMMFPLLKPWGDRKTPFWCNLTFMHPADSCMAHDALAVEQRLNYLFYTQIPQAQIFAFNPPAINGVGSFGGFQFELEDRGNVGLPALMNSAYAMMGAAAKDPRLAQVFTQFRINSPQVEVDIDRNKATAIGVPLDDVFTTMEVDLGSFYTNNFTYLNRSWQVLVQADAPYRNNLASLGQLYVHSNSAPGLTVGPSAVPTPIPGLGTSSTTATGTVMTPLSALMTAKQVLGPPIITHYNLYRNIELSGQNAPGASTTTALTAMEQIAAKVLPKGVSFEWTGLQLDQIAAGPLTIEIFILSLIFVFLVLSAQYESFIDPLIVLLAVPAALLGALAFINLRHFPIPFLFDPSLSQDIYAQVGYVMLIGLASKSAILIVEFANQQLREGATVVQAALRGAETRLRPILMTSIAFIIAVIPLVFASGAGEASRHSLGTVVFGGMLVSTVLNLGITPVLYVIVKSFELRGKNRNGRAGTDGHASSDIAETTPQPTGV
ncbi:MAG TPA: efflux RND transporter permease subunit [Candidatus Baltobacteraceae bacterium]|nr:efflux RND transporter permease subunit [Candidatus Baltobacteraceae bacterium]